MHQKSYCLPRLVGNQVKHRRRTVKELCTKPVLIGGYQHAISISRFLATIQIKSDLSDQLSCSSQFLSVSQRPFGGSKQACPPWLNGSAAFGGGGQAWF